MSDFIERIINLYHLRWVPTVKRMCDRRRIAYTLLTVGVLCISAVVLSLLVFHTVGVLETHGQLEAEYEAYLDRVLIDSSSKSTMPEMVRILALSKAEGLATAFFGGLIWLLLSVTAVGRIMTSVIESEAYVYGLYMIYGAGQKQLRNQLSTEFLLAGLLALLLGIPVGYGFVGRSVSFSIGAFWVILPCFLLLIYVSSTVLAKRILGHSCMRMLNAADTSDYTVSPHRSHLAGLSGKPRGAMASASLAIWRMRKHYGSLTLVIAVIAALVFGVLSPMGQTTESIPAAFTLEFPDGLDADSLDWQYVYPLQKNSAVNKLEYGIRNTAENLGTHILADGQAIGTAGGVPLGERYATDSFRIACGDGDTFDELGGSVTIPPEFQGKPLTELGYDLDAVPVGGATYVYPEGTQPPLSLTVGDTIRLYLPSENGASPGERVENERDFLTVRVTEVVAVGSICVKGSGQEVCPRITEDYLYLNPLDYGRFDGQTHARGLVAEEAFPLDLFTAEEESTCILVVPSGYFASGSAPTHITVITPAEAVTIPFSDTQSNKVLPANTYFMNFTSKGTGVYLGTEKEYMEDNYASGELEKWAQKNLALYTESPPTLTVHKEYQVEQVIFTEKSGLPYLLLPLNEEIHYSALQTDVCAFRLGEISNKAPRLTGVSEEAFLLETDSFFGSSFYGHTCYIGTTLLPDFLSTMKEHGVSLQFPEGWFTHTETIIRNSFSLDDRSYLLTEYYPYIYMQSYLQAEEYPRVITGTGSFCSVGNTSETSFLTASDLGVFGLFDGDSIGRLKDESVAVGSLYARNDWVVSPVSEALPHTTLSAGHAIFLTDGDVSKCPIQAGDILSIAIRADTTDLLSDPEIMALSGHQLLAYLLGKLEYRYVEVTVDRVMEGNCRELVLSEADLTSVLGQAGTYTDLEIFLSPSVSMAAYLRLHADITGLVKQSGGTAVMSYYEQFITDARTNRGQDLTVLRTMGILALCTVPLLLLAAQFVFFEKRADEFQILRAIGQTPRKRQAQFAAETGLTACLLGIGTAAACPVGYLLTLFLADLVGATISLSAFDPLLYGVIFLSVAVSCLLVGFLSYLRVGREGGRARQKSIHKNKTLSMSEKVTNHEGSGM